jgi:peroxiredoxin
MKALHLLAGVALAGTTWAAGIKPGAEMPAANVKMKCVDGKEVTLAEIKGEKGTLVVFSCLHCPFAQAWEARIVKLANGCHAQAIGAIMINSNDPKVAGDTFEAMKKRAKKSGYEFPYAVDATSDVARAFGASKTPEVFLFDAEGKLVYHGAVDDNSKENNVNTHYLKDALDALVAGKELQVKETKAVGCGIKFRPKK